MEQMILNQKTVNSTGEKPEEILLLLSLNCNCNLSETIDDLLSKGFIGETFGDDCKFHGKYFISDMGKGLLEKFYTSDLDYDETALNETAQELKKIFPEGKKGGTNYYWTEGVPLIMKRLKLFFKKYGNRTKEEITDAAKRYVESFGEDRRYMKLLKYFILKEAVGKAGDVESQSDLLTWIENKSDRNEAPEDGDDWTISPI